MAGGGTVTPGGFHIVFMDLAGPPTEGDGTLVTLTSEQADMPGDDVSSVPGVTGASGSPQDIAKAVKAFRIHARHMPLDDGGATADHSTMVFLCDDDGRLFAPVGDQKESATALAKIQRLLAGQSPRNTTAVPGAVPPFSHHPSPVAAGSDRAGRSARRTGQMIRPARLGASALRWPPVPPSSSGGVSPSSLRSSIAKACGAARMTV